MRTLCRCFCILCMLFHVPWAQCKDTAEKLGDVGQILVPAAALSFTYRRDDPSGRHQFLKAWFSSMLMTYSLKYTIPDQRPNGGSHSFVSGHTASAFSGAAFLHRRYGWRTAWPAYAAASFVGWSRIHAGKHDREDVFRGAVIGFAGAWLFARPIGRNGMLIPILGPHTVGASVSFTW